MRILQQIIIAGSAIGISPPHGVLEINTLTICTTSVAVTNLTTDLDCGGNCASETVRNLTAAITFPVWTIGLIKAIVSAIKDVLDFV
jgi:hypothetical protein